MARNTSAAYEHTALLRLELDARGRSFEVRGCRLCAAEFSFRGGTTSAALRHLKRAHPELKSVFAATPPTPSTPSTPSTPAPAPEPKKVSEEPLERPKLAMQQQQQHKQQREGERAEPAQAQPQVQPQSVATVVPAALLQQQQHRIARLRANGGGDGAVAARGGDFRESVKQAIAARPPQQIHVPAEALESTPNPRGRLERKRPRGDNERNDAENGNGTEATLPSAPGPAASNAPETPTNALHAAPLTASQQAIAHFLENYKELLPVRGRLRFVKHLTHHPREAEMYNVLDTATQIEFVREFTGPGV